MLNARNTKCLVISTYTLAAWGLHALSLNYRLINPRRSVINPRRSVINPLTSYRAVLYNKVNFFQNLQILVEIC